MTITIDEKRRASLGSEFKPGDSFRREVHGNTVIFRKVEVSPNKKSVARFEKRGRYTVGMLDHTLDKEKIKEGLAEFPAGV